MNRLKILVVELEKTKKRTQPLNIFIAIEIVICVIAFIFTCFFNSLLIMLLPLLILLGFILALLFNQTKTRTLRDEINFEIEELIEAYLKKKLKDCNSVYVISLLGNYNVLSFFVQVDSSFLTYEYLADLTECYIADINEVVNKRIKVYYHIDLVEVN